ncbi:MULTISPECIES: hypothetical protein [unclassified Lentimonas]|uniref:hypothetical protein n=1 Tax=unclassified Lentimonas TaxID=2630993 RepID=UPI00132C9201|nr:MULTISPECIES: hypothetical protein [unclassified Lentimonas]CAA6691232.1 Unannotated [Lentimonas sp. CC19]CAA6694826.1 Unannotated [Lentimonas sp. CC10]CAA7071610.1 Unannotated [Lentimonas sp. CC11]
MPPLNIGALRAVAAKLDPTGFNYAFTGGSIVNLLIDNPEFSPARPTDDVDVIIELVSAARYSDIEATLRQHGFEHDMSADAPICRWRLGELIVDIMPTQGEQIGLNTRWFTEVLAHAIETEYAHTSLKIVSAVGLLVTKYLTFTERDEGDYYASHDLEDFITVIDGRTAIVEEINCAPEVLRNNLIRSIQLLNTNEDFQEALPGHLPPDTASQLRLPQLKQKLKDIAALNII